MTDSHYAEEQADEVAILQSIYPTEFQEITTDPVHKFAIAIAIDEEDDIRPCTLLLTVEYTAQYPEELPIFSIAVDEDPDAKPLGETDAVLDSSDIDKLHGETAKMGEDMLGMAMVFSMASNLKDIARDRLVDKTDALKRKREARLQKEIEADQAKFVGTPVTPENFLEWKRRFEAEMALDATRLADTASTDDKAPRRTTVKGSEGKLTGRQLFEQDRTLANKYADGGDTVPDSKE
ncbi:rwd domain-containing protein [Coemansia sp. RSA 552]|nr:rwd domain-containing protein [Coemansia sp. RSA 552]